jgi:hypothetical protein
MKYWAYFAAKLAAATGVMRLVWLALVRLTPDTPADRYYWEVYHKGRFGHDLTWTFTVLLFWLLFAGLVYLAVWDQRRRCRVCLRRLRMPVERGSWTHLFLIGPPRTEYICPYGHGTLAVPEVHLSGTETPNWQPHGDDIWKELSSLDKKS